MRIGHGFDVHELVEGRPLILGGVTIEHTKGLMGHSDADVLIHALCDAILGALGLGDIGHHFPDSSDEFAGADSRELLRDVVVKMQQMQFELGNADLTIVAQAPKLASHLPRMKSNLASDLLASKNQINIKATTTEKLGFVGQEQGMAAHAVVVLVPVGSGE